MVLTFRVKFLLILVVMILVYHSLALSNYCAVNIGDTNLGDNNVNISCAILSNTLNASWITEEHVDSLRIDYTCTTSGLEQVTGTVFGWGRLSEGNMLIEDIFPTARSPLSFEPTCFIDGCYDWTSPRARFPTWSVPAVVCTVTPEIVEISSSVSPPVMTITPQLQNLAESLSSSFISTVSLSSRFNIPTESQLLSSFEFSMVISMEGPTSDQAGLMLYIWIVVGVVIATGLSVILIGAVIIITLRKKRANWKITENQPESIHPAEHDEIPHQLGILSAEQLHKKSQLPPMGLFRNPEVINEHSKGKDITSHNMSEIMEQEENCCQGTLSVEQQVKRSRLPPLRLFTDSNKYSQQEHQNSKRLERSKETRKLVNDNTLEITEQEQNCCPGTLSVEQQVKRSRLSPLKLLSRSKDINKQPQKQLHRSKETKKMANNNRSEITEHEASPRIGLHTFRTKGEHWDDKSRNDSDTLKVQRPTSKDTASTSASTSAQHSVNDTLEDIDGRGHRERLPIASHHRMMCHGSEVTNNNNEDECTL